MINRNNWQNEEEYKDKREAIKIFRQRKRVLFKSKLEYLEIACNSNEAKKFYQEVNSIRKWFKPQTLQAGLVLHKGYDRENCCTNRTQNFHLKQYISGGLWGWQPHLVQCMTIPLMDIWTCRVYMYCIYGIHMFLYKVHPGTGHEGPEGV